MPARCRRHNSVFGGKYKDENKNEDSNITNNKMQKV
jgi:hypothetical protein